MKSIFVVVICSLFYLNSLAQSPNSQAFELHEKAVAEFKSNNYLKSIEYIKQSKNLLAGTNFRLQYLHVVSLYYSKNYLESNSQLDTYYSLINDKNKSKKFYCCEDKLLPEESKLLLSLMDKIPEQAYREKNKCTTCNGVGQINTKEYCTFCSSGKINYTCNECSKGIIKKTCSNCSGSKYAVKVCYHCNGSRTLKCTYCYGAGYTGYGTYSMRCTSCNASGYKNCSYCWGVGTQRGSCNTCNGKGHIKQTCYKCDGYYNLSKTCEKCSGNGYKTISNNCKICSGIGYFKK